MVRLNFSTSIARSFIDPDYVFTYIKSGRGIYVVEGVEYTVQAGDMLLMAPYMLHITRNFPGQELEQCVVHFDLFHDPARAGAVDCAPEMDFRRFASDKENRETLLADAPLLRTSIPESVQAQACRCYERLRSSFNGKRDLCRLLRERALVLELLSLYLEQDPGQERGSSENALNWRNLERALAFIHVRHSSKISLDELSREAGLSCSYFCMLFKRHTGQTPLRYINELRLREAKRLMAESELSLTEIADATGLGDIHAFSKTFKRHERRAPSEHLRKVRGRAAGG